MILSVTFSKPVSALVVQNSFCAVYKKIRIRLDTASSGNTRYFCEMFTEKQVFHKKMSQAELTGFIEEHAGKTFKNCVVRTDEKEITYLANKKGKVTKLEKPLKQVQPFDRLGPSTGSGTDYAEQKDRHAELVSASLPKGSRNKFGMTGNQFEMTGNQFGMTGLNSGMNNRKKNYLLPEGNPVPFLVFTGIMTPEGKVISSRYDKFRQINRFLEFIDDILPEVLRQKPEEEPLRIADFGCGKSYLTFAVHYFLTQIRRVPCEIEGLDLKKDVIEYCNKIASDLKLEGIRFSTGDISDYSGEKNPHLVVTLHACDTATDFALEYAVSKSALAILSVPCCQHQVNTQLQENKGLGETKKPDDVFAPLLKWGIIREKFSSLVTDALRAEYLESEGYKVQMLEFIDMEHTPKNILIRAVKKADSRGVSDKACQEAGKLAEALKISPEILKNSL